MSVKKGEIQVDECEGLNVVEGGKVVQDRCESIWDNPVELFVLGEVQRTNVGIGSPQAGSEPGLKVGEGAQLEVCEEVIVAPIYPAGRDEGTREETLPIAIEHVDYFLDDLLGKVRYNHFGVEGGTRSRTDVSCHTVWRRGRTSLPTGRIKTSLVASPTPSPLPTVSPSDIFIARLLV